MNFYNHFGKYGELYCWFPLSICLSLIVISLNYLIPILQMDNKINSINSKNVNNYNKGKTYINGYINENNSKPHIHIKIKNINNYLQKKILIDFFNSNLTKNDLINSNYKDDLEHIYPNINSNINIKKIKSMNFLFFLYTMLKNKENKDGDLEVFPIKSEWKEYKKSNSIYKKTLKVNSILFIISFVIIILFVIGLIIYMI